MLTARVQRGAFLGVVGESFQFAYGLELLALAVALLGIGQMLLVSAVERVREIGDHSRSITLDIREEVNDLEALLRLCHE